VGVALEGGVCGSGTGGLCNSLKTTGLCILVSPVATVTPTQLEVELGRTVVVECEGAGDPLPDTRWLLLPAMTVLPSTDHPNYVSLCVCSTYMRDLKSY